MTLILVSSLLLAFAGGLLAGLAAALPRRGRVASLARRCDELTRHLETARDGFGEISARLEAASVKLDKPPELLGRVVTSSYGRNAGTSYRARVVDNRKRLIEYAEDRIRRPLTDRDLVLYIEPDIRYRVEIDHKLGDAVGWDLDQGETDFVNGREIGPLGGQPAAFRTLYEAEAAAHLRLDALDPIPAGEYVR